MNIAAYTENYLLAPITIFLLLWCSQRWFSFSVLDRIASWLNSRGLFSTAELPADQLVINCVRIIFGVILSYRLYNIALFTLPLDPSIIELAALALYATLCVTLTLGVLAPISALLMLLFQLHFNFTLHTYTLGNDVAAMILLSFVLYPIGQVMSIDAMLAKKFRWVRALYRWFTISNRNTQVTLAKAVPFLSYSMLCLYSVLLHLNEPLWMNGEAAVHLLSSSFLSRYSEFFQSLFSHNGLAVWIAKLSMIGMVAWYLLLLPAVLIGGIFRKIVILWAILFFLVSQFILQLSVLPFLEFLILIIWFWDYVKTAEPNTLNMLYDDRCNLCDRTVRTLRLLDIHSIIRYRPISKNTDKAEFVGVDSNQLYQNLYSWETGSQRVYAGYDFYLHISRKLILLMPLFPLLWLLNLLMIGPAIYRVFAKYRIKWFGVCTLPSATDQPVVSSALIIEGDAQKESGRFFKPFLLTTLIYGIVFLAILPISPLATKIQTELPNLVRTAHILSWTRINVFNREDLGMTQHYYTVTALSQDTEDLLPITGKNGERLSWHSSDRAYFGNTLQWRRWKNTRDMLPPHKRDIAKFCEVIAWAVANDIAGLSGYRVDFYQSPWPTNNGAVYTFEKAQIMGSIELSKNQCAL